MKTIKLSDFKRRMAEYGREMAGNTPEELRGLRVTEIGNYRKIAAVVGMGAE